MAFCLRVLPGTLLTWPTAVRAEVLQRYGKFRQPQPHCWREMTWSWTGYRKTSTPKYSWKQYDLMANKEGSPTVQLAYGCEPGWWEKFSRESWGMRQPETLISSRISLVIWKTAYTCKATHALMRGWENLSLDARCIWLWGFARTESKSQGSLVKPLNFKCISQSPYRCIIKWWKHYCFQVSEYNLWPIRDRPLSCADLRP